VGKVRDFRAATIADIRANLVDDENAGDFWDSVGDWFQDVFSFDKDLRADLSNFDQYMGRICEINDITAQKLDRIVGDVHAVEGLYAARMEADAYNFGQVSGMLKVLTEEISKGDFEKGFDAAAVGARLDAYQFKDQPLDFSALPPNLAAKEIASLPADKVAAALALIPDDKLAAVLALIPLDALCAVDPAALSKDQQALYYDEVADRLTRVKAGSPDYVKLSGAYYDPDYAAYLCANPAEADKVKQVVRDELSMPEGDLMKVNTFMAPLEVRDRIQTKYLAYTAQEPYRELFFRYLDKFTIASLTTDPGAFTAQANTLVFDVVDDRTDPRGAYYTFFHEIGHAIDYYYGMENGYGPKDDPKREKGYNGFFSSGYRDASGTGLSDWNKQDVGNAVNRQIDDLFKKPPYNGWSAEDLQRARDAVVNNLLNHNLDEGSLTSDELGIQDTVTSSLSLSLRGPDNESAADVYGGVTNNEVAGDYIHKPNKTRGSYWLNPNGTVKTTTEHESFAEYYGRNMTREPQRTEGLRSIDANLPGSKAFMDEMLQMMGQGG